MHPTIHRRALLGLALAAVALAPGCATTGGPCLDFVVPPEVPRELAKSSLPPYVIETPDILLIDALRVVPLPPYRIEPLDSIVVQLVVAAPGFDSINAVLPVESDGSVNLGSYGATRVADLTIEQARDAIGRQVALRVAADKIQLVVGPGQSRGSQQIRGQHLVRPDGTVSLGLYGSVYVQGMTLLEAKAAVEQHLGHYLYKPEVSIDVFAYNSKVYYVLTDGGGAGEGVYRLPATGNETVLDAVSYISGLPAVASKNRIWVARPAPAGHHGPDQILPVDWNAITRGARTNTNYQILPGDRIYVMAQPLVTADTYLARTFAPIERVFGITLLGNAAVNSFRSGGGGNGTTNANR